MTSPAVGTSSSLTPLPISLLLNALIGGRQWTSTNITYSFIGSGSMYSTSYPDKSFWSGISSFDSAQIAASKSALSAWSNVANITFSQVADNSTVAGTLRFGFSSGHAWGNAAATAYLPNSSASGGDMFFNPDASDSVDSFLNTFWYSDFLAGDFSYMTLLHEIGHAIGLKHPFDTTSDNSAISTGLLDSVAGSTLMSYTRDSAHPDATGFSYYPTTLMPLDMLAVQYIYGANTSFNSGNTTYSFSDANGKTYFETIWDGGGINTIAFTGATNSILDLREGRGSYVGNPVYEHTASQSYAYTTPNLYIAHGTTISEVRLSGLGNDQITLNSKGNTVAAGGGNDTIVTQGGNDTVDGGDGRDTVTLPGMRAQYDITPGSGSYTITDGVATTTIRNVETLIFGDLELSVSSLNYAATGQIELSGSPTRNSILTFVSSIADLDGVGVMSFQWKANGIDIAGATSGALFLSADLLGKKIALAVTYLDQRGHTETVTSASSPAVSGGFVANTAPTFTMSKFGATFDLGSDDKIASAAVLPSGKILVAGSSGQDFFVARFNVDGSIDTAYGLNGKTKINVDSADIVHSMLVQADGGVIVVGAGSSITAAMARFDASGKLDPNFGIAGFVAKQNAPDRYTLGFIAAIALQSTGKFVAGGSDFLDNSFGLARYLANGSLDPTFGVGGLVKTLFGTGAIAHSMLILPNDKILLAGETNSGSGVDAALVRYNANGTVDTSFAFDGFLSLDSAGYDSAHQIIALADGKYLLTGISGSSRYSGNALTAWRVNSNGSLDTSFDGDGKVSIALDMTTPGTEQGRAAIQSDGKILLLATIRSTDGASVVVYRLNTDGSFDKTFNGEGKVTLDVTPDDVAGAITVQSDGRILVAGATGTSTSHDAALVRLNQDGSIDRSFVSANNTGTINTLDGAVNFVETQYTFSPSKPVILDGDVQLFDAELDAVSSYGGSKLVLVRATGANLADVFSAIAGGTMGTLAAGSPLVVNGNVIGTVSSNADGMLELIFGQGATRALISQAMSQIAFYNSSDAPEAQVRIQWQFFDGNTGSQGIGAGLSVVGSTTVTITPINDAPVANSIPGQIVILGRPFSYTLPATALVDPDGDALVFKAQAGSNASWLSFDPTTRTFTGTTNSSSFYYDLITVSGTDPSGRTASSTLLLTYQEADTVAPRVIGFAPADGAINANATAPIRLAFSEAVLRGFGNIVVRDSAGTLIESFNVSSSPAISFSSSGESVVTITPTQRLPYNTKLLITIPTGSFVDSSGNPLAAVTTYDFTTAAFLNSPATGTLSVNGAATQGQVMTAVASLADADGVGAISYQWKADGVNIAGATSSALILTESQVGKLISVSASFVDGGNTRETVTGKSVEPVSNTNDLPVGAVSIQGSASQGALLTAHMSFSDLDGVGAMTYQWKAGDLPIAGASKSTLVLSQAEVGKAISVTVSYIDGHGTPESLQSSQTVAIADANVRPTGTLALSGIFKQGYTVMAEPDIQDGDGLGTLSFQWYRDDIILAGQTSRAYVLREADVGKIISVRTNYVDAEGKIESMTSSNGVPVLNLNDPGALAIGGASQVGAQLTAALIDADGIGAVSYQWQSSPDGLVWKDIASAASRSLLIDTETVTLQVRVSASYIDGHGTAEKVESAPVGGDQADRLIGTAGDDVLRAGQGNDLLTGGAGKDLLDGGAGIDTAMFAGKYAGYEIIRTALGYSISDASGMEGIDTLTGIERLLFQDQGFAFDTGTTGTAGQAYRLYQAAFARAPDAGGVGYWMAALDRGTSLADVAANFIGSAEYRLLYPANLSNNDLIARYYQNILGRAPEQDGLDYWVGVLDKNIASVPQVLAYISESVENAEALAKVIGNGFPYVPFG